MGSPQIRYTTVDVFVNDILVYKFYNGTQSYISKDFKITLSKGDVVSYSGPIAGDTYIYSYFYPMKGVN